MAPDFIGTLPGWITAISTTGGMVTLVVAYWRRGVSLKSLDNAEHADIRDHYAEEVKRYAEELQRVTERQRECEERESRLRERVTYLENELNGLIRLIAQNSANRVLQLGDDVPEDIRAAAQRVDNILKDRQ